MGTRGVWHRVGLGPGQGEPWPACSQLCLYETLRAALLLGQASLPREGTHEDPGPGPALLPQPWVLLGLSDHWHCPPPTPKTQIGLAAFSKRQSRLYLSKSSADYAGPRECLAVCREIWRRKAALNKC